MAKEEKETEKPKTVEVTSVVTETQPAFKLPDGTVLGQIEYLAWLGQQVYEIKNSVA